MLLRVGWWSIYANCWPRWLHPQIGLIILCNSFSFSMHPAHRSLSSNPQAKGGRLSDYCARAGYCWYHSDADGENGDTSRVCCREERQSGWREAFSSSQGRDHSRWTCSLAENATSHWRYMHTWAHTHTHMYTHTRVHAIICMVRLSLELMIMTMSCDVIA